MIRAYDEYGNIVDLVEWEKQIRAEAIDDFANGISEYLGVENATKYGNKNAEQQRISYDTLMKYEMSIASIVLF